MSSTFGPLDHFVGILQRSPGYIDLEVNLRDRPNVTGVRLWGSNHPHNLYGTRAGVASGMGGATPPANNLARICMLQAQPGKFATTASILTTRRLRFNEILRGTCRFIVALDDLPAPKPTDDQVIFLAIQQERAGLPVVTVDGFTGRVNRVKGVLDTNDPILGPILCVPTALQMSMAEMTLVISGEAPLPDVAMPAAGNFPNPDLDLQIINPMHLLLPRPTTSITVRNTGANALRVSYGLGQPVFEIPIGGERTHFGAVKEVCLQAGAGALPVGFSIEANINFGGTAGGV